MLIRSRLVNLPLGTISYWVYFPSRLVCRADLDAEDFILLVVYHSRAAIVASIELNANPLTDSEISYIVELLIMGSTDMSCVDLRPTPLQAFTSIRCTKPVK